MRADGIVVQDDTMMYQFQFTLPRGERHIYDYQLQEITEFQSTLPRGERPNSVLYREDSRHVSIHAPTRGATGQVIIMSAPLAVSIHAPTRGATYCTVIVSSVPLFQSTLPRGERHSPPLDAAAFLKVSIHAPTRGATPFQYVLCGVYQGFNPRSHEGSDGFQSCNQHRFF